MQKDLSQGKVFATMSLFALPMLLGNVLQQAYNVVDTWVVGRFVGAGALAGVGAGLYYLSTVAEWNPQISTALPAMGFNGISTALLACSNPIGTIFSSLFISYITVGGTKLSTQYYSKEIADVITALIIYLCAFSLLFKNKIRALLSGKAKRVSVEKGGNA